MPTSDKKLTDETKFHLIQNRMPTVGFKFPPKEYSDKTRKSGIRLRFCKREWFEKYEFLAYSVPQNGLFCLCCSLFPVPFKYGKKAEAMIRTPYRNWKHALADINNHSNLEYHRDSKVLMFPFFCIP